MCKVLEDMRNESFQEGIRIGRQEAFQEAKRGNMTSKPKHIAYIEACWDSLL